MLDDNDIVESKYIPYISDALKSVKLKFVDANADIENAPGYDVEFAYVQFGQKEEIFGYKDLSVSIVYSDLTMYSYVQFEHTGLITAVDKQIVPDDIPGLIRKEYPVGQTQSLTTKYPLFKNLCERQKEFKPFGNKIDEFECNEKKFDVYRVDFEDRTQGFQNFLGRVQTLATYFIEAASYTDPEDPKFSYYFVYEQGSPLKLAGFVVVYRFYAHPDKERIRFAQVLVLPPYRRSGFGGKFMSSVFQNLRNDNKVYDITAETPADHFIYLRDYLDCVFCKELEVLSPANIVKGYSKELEKKIALHSKIGKVQARRVYEILRYYYIQKVNLNDEEAFEAEVKKRLALPFKRSQRESKKLSEAFNEQEYAIVSAKDDPEEKKRMLETLYDDTLKHFDVVLERLYRFKPDLFPAPDNEALT